MTDKQNDYIIDTRYQSYSRVYIANIHNAEIISGEDAQSNQSKKGIIRINNTFVSKVAICGLIVNIYESLKYYRLKIDDSSGCINVTLWKNSIFNEQLVENQTSTNSFQNNANKSNFENFYKLLNGIQTRIKDETINNRIIDEPKQGDLVLIRAQIRCFRQRIELNAISCTRVQNSSNEMLHMILPSVLSNKIYSKQAITCEKYELLKTNKINQQLKIKEENQLNENLINYVNKKLIEMASSKENAVEDQSCNSYALFNSMRNGISEFKSLTHKQVLDALKELESRGLAYSCENEFQYLPI